MLSFRLSATLKVNHALQYHCHNDDDDDDDDDDKDVVTMMKNI